MLFCHTLLSKYTNYKHRIITCHSVDTSVVLLSLWSHVPSGTTGQICPALSCRHKLVFNACIHSSDWCRQLYTGICTPIQACSCICIYAITCAQNNLAHVQGLLWCARSSKVVKGNMEPIIYFFVDLEVLGTYLLRSKSFFQCLGLCGRTILIRTTYV